MAQLKGQLFEFYSKTNNTEAYQNINKRLIVYRNKINKGISEEEYILQERILQLEDEYSANYEAERFEYERETR